MSPTMGMQERKTGSNGRAVGGGGSAGDWKRTRTVDSAAREDRCHPRKLFIGGLPHKTTTQQIREHFQRFGAIADAVVLRWSDGRSRGFGYVTFVEANAASAALQATHMIGGRQVDVKRAVPGTNKLFVGGLPQNTTAAELRDHFEAFGSISDAVVLMDPLTGRSRGFGFVCFVAGQEGMTAITSALEQYKNHRIRGKWVEVKSAVPPDCVQTDEEDALLSQPSCGTPPGRAGSVSGPPGELPSTLSPMDVPVTGAFPADLPYDGLLNSGTFLTYLNSGAPDDEPRKVMLPGEALTASVPSVASAVDFMPGLYDPAWVCEDQFLGAGYEFHHPCTTWPPPALAAAANFKAPGCPPPSAAPPAQKKSAADASCTANAGRMGSFDDAAWAGMDTGDFYRSLEELLKIGNDKLFQPPIAAA